VKSTHLSALGSLAALALAAAALAGPPASAAVPASRAFLEQFDPAAGNPTGLVSHPLDVPSQYTDIGGPAGATLGLHFRPPAQTRSGLKSGTLGTIDTTTNAFTPVGTGGGAATPPANQVWAALSIDPASGAAYGLAHSVSGPATSSVTPIDLASGAESATRTLTGVATLTSTSVNCAGQMYGVDSASDKLYAIDPANGATTVVGPLGVDVGGQVGLDFDNATGVLYLWPGSGASTSGVFGSVSTTTGLFTQKPGGPGGAFEAAIRSTCPDTTPPDTAITGPTQGQVVPGPLVHAHLTSTEPGSTFRCSVDGDTYGACIADKTFTLKDGVHSLSVRAVDEAGNPDPTPASVSFRVDSTPPDTSIVSGPAYGAVIGTRSPKLTFTSTETGSTFVCSVDGRAYATCASPYAASLADGLHSFQVAAVDQAGNVDGSPATRNFRVDTTAPRTRITGGPGHHHVVRKSTVTFTFTSSESPQHFRCTLDGRRLSACTSPRRLTLTNGRHTFTVAAVDSVGNRDTTPEKRTFRVRKQRH
jgi:hypothetical protein